MRKNFLPIVLGLLIVATGVFYGGNVLDCWDINLSFDGWWTFFIIIPCVLSIFTGGINLFNVIGTGVGVLLFLSAQEILKEGLGYKLIAPYVIIVIGLSLLFRKPIKAINLGNNGLFAASREDNYFAIFGGNTPQFDGVEFRGANSYAIFGGVELKLQNARIKRDCVINSCSIFGGTDIFLPPNVRVKVTSTPIFGGVENKYVSSTEQGTHTVYIRAISIFGGTDIK